MKATPPEGRLPVLLTWILAGPLLVGAGYYLFRGFNNLVGSGYPIDLRLRWVEQRYIVRHGQNPFDLYLHDEPQGRVAPPRPITRDTTIDPDLGGIPQLAYPPWSYSLGSVILWPPWPAVRLWAALLNVASLGLVAWWAWRSGRRIGAAEGALVVAACLACADNFTVLSIGQLAIFVLAFLLASLLLGRSGHDFLSGVMLGMAMIKPTTSLPFLLVPLVRGRWRSVVAALALVAAGTLVVWIRTGVSPLEMLQQMNAVAEQVEIIKGEPGPITWLIRAGLSAPAASRLSAALFLTPCLAALWALRARPAVVLYAIAAVTSQIWTHHKGYDSPVLLLMLVPLLTMALGYARLRWLLALSGIVALSVLQLGLSHVLGPTPRVAFQMAVWVVGVSVYAWQEPRLSGWPGRLASPGGEAARGSG